MTQSEAESVGEECPKCNGSGVDAWQTLLAGYKVLCTDCEGTRKSYKEDCPICHGEGVVMDSDDPCTECDGSGKVGGLQ